MLSVTFSLFLISPFLMLRLEGGGAFQKPLPPAEEKMHVERMREGDMESRRILIERNLRLVAHIIKKFYANESDKEDLLQIGTIGLIKGINSYNPEKKTTLSTYVSRCIENEILMYFRGQKKMGGDISLSDPIDTDRDGNPLTLIDILSTNDDILEGVYARENREMLMNFFHETLTPREADIIANRYGLNGVMPKTQREIAAARGISRSYVSRIEKRALEKLKKRFEESG